MSDVEINVVASAEGVVTGGKFHDHDPWRMVASCPACVPVDVPDGVEYVEPEVRELARGIAADIRKYGHWQATKPGTADEAHCIVTSPTFGTGLRDGSSSAALLMLLVYRVYGLTITRFNDNTPTADVLAALDRIAEGLVER